MGKFFCLPLPLEQTKFWKPIKRNIETGRTDWLNAAFELRKNSDAGILEMLDTCIGSALKTNPAEILKEISNSNIATPAICAAILPDQTGYLETKKNLKELRSRLIAIEHIHNSELGKGVEQIKLSCIKELKIQISNFKKSIHSHAQ